MQLNTGGSLQSEINVTPLVDVVLVLLIIFMVVVPLLLQGYDVDIPRTTAQAVPAQAAELQLVLSIVPTACHIVGRPAAEGLPTDCRVTLNEQEILEVMGLPPAPALDTGLLPVAGAGNRGAPRDGL